jgi:hypothetical protein
MKFLLGHDGVPISGENNGASPVCPRISYTGGMTVVTVVNVTAWDPVSPNTPSHGQPQKRTATQCAGQALKKKGAAVFLDVVGAIPAFGNAVSATAAGARAIDGIVGYGSAAYGVATGLPEESPVGAATAGTGFGLFLAGTAIEGSKAIPVAGNILSGLTGLYDIYQGYEAYQQCMAGGG